MEDRKVLQMLFELEDAVISGEIAKLWKENEELEECWKKFNCNRDTCPAFGRENQRCWQISGTFCTRNLENDDLPNKWNKCKTCRVFLEATGNDESRLRELMNNIIFALKCFDPTSIRILRIKRNMDLIIKHFKLTSRENEILLMILDRMSRKDIAKALSISHETVKMHFKHIYKKLSVHSVGKVIQILDDFSNQIKDNNITVD